MARESGVRMGVLRLRATDVRLWVFSYKNEIICRNLSRYSLGKSMSLLGLLIFIRFIPCLLGSLLLFLIILFELLVSLGFSSVIMFDFFGSNSILGGFDIRFNDGDLALHQVDLSITGSSFIG
jgi:hypothetical protein